MGYIWEEIFGNLLAIILFIVGIALFIAFCFFLAWVTPPIIAWVMRLRWAWQTLIVLSPMICVVIYLCIKKRE